MWTKAATYTFVQFVFAYFEINLQWLKGWAVHSLIKENAQSCLFLPLICIYIFGFKSKFLMLCINLRAAWFSLLKNLLKSQYDCKKGQSDLMKKRKKTEVGISNTFVHVI